jgi:hypothetical protein
MIMQGIYINKDSLCIFLREKLKNSGKELHLASGRFLTDTCDKIRDKMPLPEKI